ncbi:MAG: DUF975 family protein [Peptococcaceae bacterium]|nr:DUF975 family protein [Oscillospiraceae bacterium]MBQ7026185.1 DUF975 family protein [Peptococcaceae bacterium]
MNLRQQLKFTARGFLAHAKPSPLMVGMAALLIHAVLSVLDSEVTGAAANNQLIAEAYQQFLTNNNFNQFVNTVNSIQPSFVQSALSVLLSLMIMMVSTGIVIYVISEARWHKGSYGNLFDALPILMRVTWYQIVTTVYVALWSMLLIVPGIIASYRYRQGLYILLDHPEMSVSECIRASKHMMQGKKMELFLLDLSFFGWTFGESFTLMAFTAAFGGNSYLPTFLLIPMSAYIRMYMEFTLFLYYEHLCGVHYDSRVSNVKPAEN